MFEVQTLNVHRAFSVECSRCVLRSNEHTSPRAEEIGAHFEAHLLIELLIGNRFACHLGLSKFLMEYSPFIYRVVATQLSKPFYYSLDKKALVESDSSCCLKSLPADRYLVRTLPKTC